MNAPRLLWPAAVSLSLVGLALRVAPPARPAASMPVIPASQPLPAVPALESGTEIVATNLFAVTRHPPQQRFLSRGFEASVPAPAPGPAPLVLYGTTLAAEDPLALIDADPRVPGAEIYRVGERVRDATIVAISDSTVTLAPVSGAPAFVLHLRHGRRNR